jgi:hypothetical protein
VEKIAAAATRPPATRRLAALVIISFHDAITTGMFTSFAFTLACLDSLGAGTILALVSQSGLAGETIQGYLNTMVLPLSGMAFARVFALHYYRGQFHSLSRRGRSVQAIMFGWLVYSLVRDSMGL